jgi:hypothetical protein
MPTIASIAQHAARITDVTFTSAVDETAAETVANWSIDNDVVVVSAERQTDTAVVRLTHSGLTEGVEYTVTASGDIVNPTGGEPQDYDFEASVQGWTFGTGCGRSTSVGLGGTSASIYVTQTTDTARYATGPAIPAISTGFSLEYIHRPVSAAANNRTGNFILREGSNNRFNVIGIAGVLYAVSTAVCNYTAGKDYRIRLEVDVETDKVTEIGVTNITDAGSETVYTNDGNGFAFSAAAGVIDRIVVQAYSPAGSGVSYFDEIELTPVPVTPSSDTVTLFSFISLVI